MRPKVRSTLSTITHILVIFKKCYMIITLRNMQPNCKTVYLSNLVFDIFSSCTAEHHNALTMVAQLLVGWLYKCLTALQHIFWSFRAQSVNLAPPFLGKPPRQFIST